LANIDSLYNIARVRIDQLGPRGLSHCIPFAAATRLSPSVFPPVFFSNT
jgi:hypothetical protein